MVEMGGDFRAVMIAHFFESAAGRGVGQNGVRAEERQRKAQLVGKRRKALQEGDITDAATSGGIASGEQTFFFHVEADHDTQGGWRCFHGKSVGTAGDNGKAGACQNGHDAGECGMPVPLSIAFVMEDLCFGGTQRQLLELARRLDRKRFSPTMITLTGATDMDALTHEAGIPLIHLGTGRRVPPLFFLALRRELARLRPDIVLPGTALPNIWCRIWGKLLGLPCVVGTVRGGGGPRRQHERWLWRLTQTMICNSLALREVLQKLGVPASRLHYIPNGVDTERFAPSDLPLTARPPEILCVARLAGDKDHETLFRALALVRERHPDAVLRLVGDGPREAELKAMAAASPARDGILFTPGTADVRPWYDGARIFALSSVREGQPNVILEAMACGLPVCATQVGGIPHLLDNGDCGLLSPAGDAGALAANLLRLLDSPSLGDELGRRGRQRVEKSFSFAAMVAAHETLFEKCAGRG